MSNNKAKICTPKIIFKLSSTSKIINIDKQCHLYLKKMSNNQIKRKRIYSKSKKLSIQLKTMMKL